jgi:hypothetical protein
MNMSVWQQQISTMPAQRTAASADNVHHQANRPGPVAGWTWRESRQALRLGKEEGVRSVDFYKGGGARFNFQPAQHTALPAKEVKAGQRHVNGQRLQTRRAKRAAPKQPAHDLPMDEGENLTEKQKKSAARLSVFNTEMAAVLSLKLRAFTLRALKRARHARVWRVAGPHLAARAAGTATRTPGLLSWPGVQEQKAADDKGLSGAKRASRPSPTKMSSPLSSTPSKSRPRTDAVAVQDLARGGLFHGAMVQAEPG